MITNKEFEKRIKENKWFELVSELIEYRFPVIEYWLKHKAKGTINTLTNKGLVQINTSQIIPKKPTTTDDHNFRLMNILFDYIQNPEKYKIPFLPKDKEHLIIP